MPCSPGDTLDLDGLDVRVVPAFHGVTMDDAYGDGSAIDGRPRFVGYVLGGAGRLYHAGDTIVTDALTAALEPLGVDVALLPVNGRDEEREARGIVGNMDAREAVELALAVGATLLVPIHWDGFAGNTVPPGAAADAAAGRLHVTVPARFVPLRGSRPCSSRRSGQRRRRRASRRRQAADVGGRVRDQRASGDLGRVLVAGGDPDEDRLVQRERPTARALRRRRELERRSQHRAQDAAQVAEQLVVARGEDPVVEAQVGGEIRGLVADARPPCRRTPRRSRRPRRRSHGWRPGVRRAARSPAAPRSSPRTGAGHATTPRAS